MKINESMLVRCMTSPKSSLVQLLITFVTAEVTFLRTYLSTYFYSCDVSHKTPVQTRRVFIWISESRWFVCISLPTRLFIIIYAQSFRRPRFAHTSYETFARLYVAWIATDQKSHQLYWTSQCERTPSHKINEKKHRHPFHMHVFCFRNQQNLYWDHYFDFSTEI